MKINVSITASEKAYIQSAIRRFAPNFNQADMWADMDKSYPAYRSLQNTDQAGNVDATLDINSQFIMDLVDVAAEVAEKAKSFSFMMKGVWNGIKTYGKNLAVRFDRWMPEVDAMAEAEETIGHFLEHEDCSMDDGDFAAVVVNTDKDSFLGLNGSIRVKSHLAHSRSWADLHDMVSHIVEKGELGSNPATFYFIIDGDHHAISIDPEQIFNSMSYKIAYRQACEAQEKYATEGRPIEEGEMIAVSDKGTVKVFDSYELNDACTKLIGDENAEYVNAFIIKSGHPAYVCTASGKPKKAANEISDVNKAIDYVTNMTKDCSAYDGKFIAVYGNGCTKCADTINWIRHELRGTNNGTAYILKVVHGVVIFITTMDTNEKEEV